jgi:arsenate reductase (thioredoxin)
MQVVSSNPPLNVLFLYTGNSARSIMAEAILNRLGLGKFKASSAGSYPKGEVNPHALAVLRKSNFDVSKLRSKSWDEFAAPGAPKLDFVFTVCDDAAKEVCPGWPGQPMTAHWGLPDPAKAEGSEAEQALALADCFGMLYQRISIFVSLPLRQIEQVVAAKASRGHRQDARSGHQRAGLTPLSSRRNSRPTRRSVALTRIVAPLMSHGRLFPGIFWSLSAGFMCGR